MFKRETTHINSKTDGVKNHKISGEVFILSDMYFGCSIFNAIRQLDVIFDRVMQSHNQPTTADVDESSCEE